MRLPLKREPPESTFETRELALGALNNMHRPHALPAAHAISARPFAITGHDHAEPIQIRVTNERSLVTTGSQIRNIFWKR